MSSQAAKRRSPDNAAHFPVGDLLLQAGRHTANGVRRCSSGRKLRECHVLRDPRQFRRCFLGCEKKLEVLIAAAGAIGAFAPWRAPKVGGEEGTIKRQRLSRMEVAKLCRQWWCLRLTATPQKEQGEDIAGRDRGAD